ncbi:MAG: RHS repeat domain-containing protein [Pigmentiphaga sp.]
MKARMASLADVLLVMGVLCSGTAIAQGYRRTELITYHDNTIRWVLGQTASVTCVASIPASSSCDGDDVMAQTVYDPATALPAAMYAFGRLQSAMTYNADGTLATWRDGRGNVTTFGGWKRGIPQSIQYADGTSQSAVVDDNGWIVSVTNETGSKTCYGYDAMGRLSAITYPSETAAGVCNTTAWAPTSRSFVQVNADEYGIAAGHWRLTETTGNAVKATYYDALWRPLLVREYDAADPTGTQRFTRTAYDPEGRVAFQSYPAGNSTPTTGTWTEYDALGRVTSVAQDSEQGLLVSATEYLPGFRTRVTNPRGFQTVTSYQAYDQPTTDWPVAISAPEGQLTTITRDPYGKPVAIARGSTVRTYGYDSQQQLCRSEEPETGTTLYTYDAAGNLTGSAAGLPAGTACGTPNTRTVSRGYDARNRLVVLQFLDGNGDQSWTYTPDGLPAVVTTANAGSSVTNTYSYNRRRLLTAETMTPDTLLPARTLGYGYDRQGQVVVETYPDAATVRHTRNALGQVTAITTQLDGGAEQPAVSAARYYPNGALAQFTYGNGIVHTMTQNARQLPARSTDGAVLDLGLAYDAAGNVVAITDGTPGGRQTRSLGYDGLDRLVTATSPMFGAAAYAYDAQDNLMRVQVTGGRQPRDHYYCYNARNQLEFVRSGPDCNGSPAVVALGYDAQGNLAFKNGRTYGFDYGNRLRSAAGQGYRYDAQGRRVRSDVGGAQRRYSFYAQDGRLLWQRDEVAGTRSVNVYLAGSLVAEVRRPLSGANASVSFLHTDPLGSPIAKTDATGAVVETSEYEPYGLLLNRANDDRPGYTGHVMDSATGLTYMQQRYYDPAIGRFLSVDQVTAYEKPMINFNRYVYALNNPYRFTDPDGRNAVTAFGGLIQESWNAMNGRGFDGQMVLGALKDGYDGEGDGFARAAFDDATSFVPTGALAGGAIKLTRVLASIARAEKIGGLAQMSGMLRAAAAGKGNFGIGSATAKQSDAMGRAWVGKGHTVASDGKTLVSKDGLRQYRPPSEKNSPHASTGVQANFEQRVKPEGRWQSNGHLDIVK